MRADPETEAALVGVLESFCTAFTRRDSAGVLEVVAPDADLVVVTSEKALLRGVDQLRQFLASYARGPTTYSWEWERYDVSAAGDAAWLLAEGVETAVTADTRERHPYRMTMVCERRGGRWLLVQVHGSSPH